MTSRPLHAVLLPASAASGRLLDALSAAIDGSGPAILPLDPALPRSRLDELLAAFAPATMETADNRVRVAHVGRGTGASPAVADDIAVVLATSGSTGMPKGAELTAAALLASARASLARLGGRPGDRWLCDLPTHHISGLGILVRSLVSGSTPAVITGNSRGAGGAGAAAAQPVISPVGGTGGGLQPDSGQLPEGWDGCAYVSLVPTQLRRLLDARVPLAGLRGILLGGAAIPPGMLQEAAAAGARVVTSYGMTETCGGCVYDGLPLDGVRVRSGIDGRIAISGPVLFSRYRLAPGPTSDALDDGWFVTSDLGGVGKDGRLAIRGRADDVINSGGEKVVCDEVERVLRGCAAVRDVAVVGAPDPVWGERVTAITIPADPASPPSLEQLREHVRASLPGYAAPRALLVVAEIPLLASGKPDRQRLRQLAESAVPVAG